MEAEVLIDTFGSNFLSFIKIDNLPSLLWLFSSINDHYWLTFSIFSVLNIKAFTSSLINVAEMICLILEELEPL
jgi:hypothetical protein